MCFQRPRTFLKTCLAVLLICGLLPAASQASQVVKRSIQVGGLERSYILVLPDNPSAKSRWPVIVGYHPAAAKGNWMLERAALHRAPGGNEYVVAYPDGYYPTFNAGDCCGRAFRNKVDDTAFFRAMLADISNIVPTEPGAFVTGFSNGARMSYHLMCVLPDLVRAAAPVGATRNVDNCKSSRIPLLHIHGEDDKGSPLNGGQVAGRIGEQIGYMESAADVFNAVARRNGCSRTATQINMQRELGTTCTAYKSCGGGAETTLCVVPNLGHAWPGAPRGLPKFGPFRPELAASTAIVRFFNQHR